MADDEKWVAVETRNGAWVKTDSGDTIAMVANPMADVVAGKRLSERAAAVKALALSRARKIAAAPDMARALLDIANCNAVFAPCRDCSDSARAALKKAGVL